MKKVIYGIIIVLIFIIVLIGILSNKNKTDETYIPITDYENKDTLTTSEEIQDKRDISNYSLGIDVSQFNIIGMESIENPNKNFRNEIDFANFIKNNNIKYVYIRLGGRGWGAKGNMYYDDKVNDYCNICEELKIPYGFYFLDEALNNEEIFEEVKFVQSFLKDKSLEMNMLPLALDLEYQHGKGRTDNIWDARVPLVNNLVNEFAKVGIDTIIYANGARIETYLKTANCKFWVAMYREDNKIPKTSYQNMIKKEQEKIQNNPELIEQSVLNTELNKCRHRNNNLF